MTKTINAREYLCYHDKRNPFYIEDTGGEDNKSGQCYCDNCFYQRHELAVRILELESQGE